MLDRVNDTINGGSYGWGDGQWMRDWEERCNAAGAKLACPGVMANYAPGEDSIEECKSLGAALAWFSVKVKRMILNER